MAVPLPLVNVRLDRRVALCRGVHIGDEERRVRVVDVRAIAGFRATSGLGGLGFVDLGFGVEGGDEAEFELLEGISWECVDDGRHGG